MLIKFSRSKSFSLNMYRLFQTVENILKSLHVTNQGLYNLYKNDLKISNLVFCASCQGVELGFAFRRNDRMFVFMVFFLEKFYRNI